MYSWKELPDNSRVWVYQSNRDFSNEEAVLISQKGQDFLREWTSHGSNLKAAIEVFHERFLVVFVDEEQVTASGCSIDKSVHFIQEVEQQFGMSLFDRMQVAYLYEGELKTCHVNNLSEKRLGPEVTIFNNMVQTKAEFIQNWKVPLKESWVADRV